ncbi:MAG: alpha/beta hydrolase [Burkholderiales bacterium]
MTAAIPAAALESRYFTTSDGVRLHYLQGGQGQTLVFVPGWSMPADIFAPQLERFARTHRVIAFDPRSQGRSAIAASGHNPERRGDDLAELIAKIGAGAGGSLVLVGWSLGVLDSLAYVQRHGDAAVAAFVWIDNSIGEEPPPQSTFNMPAALLKDRNGMVKSFVRAMFKQPRDEAYLDRLTETVLRVPLGAQIQLISYPWPRDKWRQVVYSSNRPVLYAVTPRWAEQGANLKRNHPRATVEVFEKAGHALFVDEPARFNNLLEWFLAEWAAPR